jgi:hypothetical protein
MTKIGLIQFLLLLLISAAYGQKVKYKDIYALLSTKQFDQAEPFLKFYLRETIDNPNAYLFMGNIYQEKASKKDVLKQTRIAIANMDSAIQYYDKAYKSLDEREVRKNKEYYESYNRRDLRTGDFGVKLSDIQFDLEKRIEGLKERMDKVKMVKHFFALADTTYQRSNALYLSLQRKFLSETQLYLRADEQTIKDLTTLAVRFDSCVKAFDNYKTASSSVGKTGYNQKISLSAITDFRKDGGELPDFYADEVKLWDYKKFADESRSRIEKEVMPMRQHLIAYDMEINKLREKLNADSVSVRNDLTKLIDKLLYDQLKKFDSEPLPMMVFALKTTDLEYRSTVLEHKPARDSADIHLQIRMLKEELKVLSKLDSASLKIGEEKLAEKALDYADFIKSTYSNPSVLNSYLRSLKEFGLREERKKTALLSYYTKALNYIVDGADSIPLSGEIVSFFRPLVTTPEKYTMGLSVADSTHVQGYFYTITPSRKPEVKAYFPVDKVTGSVKNLPSTKALAFSDVAGQIYYVLVYSEKSVKEKFPATLAKIYRSDGLAWKVDYPLSFTPSELVLKTDTGELLIKNDTQQTVVDKNGKVVK